MLDIDTGAEGGKLVFKSKVQGGKDSQLWSFYNGYLLSRTLLVAQIEGSGQGAQVRQIICSNKYIYIYRVSLKNTL